MPDESGPTALFSEVNLEKLREHAGPQPPVLPERERDVVYRDPREAKPAYWENYLKACQQLSEPHARWMMEVMDHYDVDPQWSYETEIRNNMGDGREAVTTHKTPVIETLIDHKARAAGED